MKEEIHKPVMLAAVLKHLGKLAPLNTQAKIIDATLGLGGYTKSFCEKGALVLGIEIDPKMLEIARNQLERDCPSFKPAKGNFKDIYKIAQHNGFSDVDAVVYDLGVSSPQITSSSRGFSFKNKETQLDMRLDPHIQGIRAMDLLNALNKTALQALFERTCEPHEARRLVKRIIAFRKIKHFEKVADILEVIKGIFPVKPRIHPATRVFLALRMAVNSEIENLTESLGGAVRLLKKGGKIVVVSFHSGEDSVVKKTFLDFEQNGLGKVLTKKPEIPDEFEVYDNPRARSAKLRVFIKK